MGQKSQRKAVAIAVSLLEKGTSGFLRPGQLQSQKTAKDAKSAKERKIRNKRFYRLFFFFLGALDGSKKDFAIVLFLGPGGLASLARLKIRISRLALATVHAEKTGASAQAAHLLNPNFWR